MLKYINFRKRKLPFIITMSTLINYSEKNKEDFLQMLLNSNDLLKLGKSLLLILELGLESGYAYEKRNPVKTLLNLIFTKTKYGVKKDDLQYILDHNWSQLVKMIPEFFTKLQDQAFSTSGDMVEDAIKEIPEEPKKK